jgi:hypothetical protein
MCYSSITLFIFISIFVEEYQSFLFPQRNCRNVFTRAVIAPKTFLNLNSKNERENDIKDLIKQAKEVDKEWLEDIFGELIDEIYIDNNTSKANIAGKQNGKNFNPRVLHTNQRKS